MTTPILIPTRRLSRSRELRSVLPHLPDRRRDIVHVVLCRRGANNRDQKHGFPVKTLSDRTDPFRVAHVSAIGAKRPRSALLIERRQVERFDVAAADGNALRAHGLQETHAGDPPDARVVEKRIDVVDVLAAFTKGGHPKPWQPAQRSRQMSRQALAGAVLLRELAKLAAPEGRLELGHPVVPSEDLRLVRARLARRDRRLAMIADQAGDRGDRGVVRDQHTPFTGHQILSLLEREYPSVAEYTDPCPLVSRRGRLRAILDHAEPMSSSDLLELFHQGGLAEEVDWNHGAGARGNHRFQRLRVQAERLLLHVGEDRDGAVHEGTSRRRGERVRWDDHLLARGDAARDDRGVQRRGRRVEGGGEARAVELGELLLELPDPTPAEELLARARDERAEASFVEDFKHRPPLRFPDHRIGGKRRVSGPRTTEEGESAHEARPNRFVCSVCITG